jgi:hypothetical protein
MAAICIVVIVLAQYASVTYIAIANPTILTLDIGNTSYLFNLNAVDSPPWIGQSPESHQGWRTVILDILKTIRIDAANRHIRQPASVMVLVTSETSTFFFEQSLFMYYAYIENLDLRFTPWQLQIGATSPDPIIKFACSSDYVVVKEHAGLDSSSRVTYLSDSPVLATISFIATHQISFEKIGVYQLPSAWWGPKNATLYWHNRAANCPEFESSPNLQDGVSLYRFPKAILEAHRQCTMCRDRTASLWNKGVNNPETRFSWTAWFRYSDGYAASPCRMLMPTRAGSPAYALHNMHPK